MPDHPLRAVRAYMSFDFFGALPYAGGAFDQPADLLAEMQLVHSVVVRCRNDEQQAANKRSVRSA